MPITDVDEPVGIDKRIDPAVGEMIQKLARRQHALVDGALVLLDELEQDETSPARLDRLFKVDHLAVLLSRSATSIGVLLDASHQPSHDPLPLTDLLQAAVGGVGDFRRVELPRVPVREVASEAVADLVHLLSELIDYVLECSSTEGSVNLEIAEVAGSTRIRIASPGLTLTEGQAEAINTELLGLDRSDVVSTGSMALQVIAKLARRHGILVRLASDGGGTTATVSIPSSLLFAQRDEASASATDYVGRHRKESEVSTAGADLLQRLRRTAVRRGLTLARVVVQQLGPPANSADGGESSQPPIPTVRSRMRP